jgi:hypothetical protein
MKVVAMLIDATFESLFVPSLVPCSDGDVLTDSLRADGMEVAWCFNFSPVLSCLIGRSMGG